ncbi:hypothetical protein B0J13DRAFT_410494, partial [Dactylonectria estremocensis]
AVESFLGILSGPLAPLAAAFREEIKKADGFTDFCSWGEVSNQDSSGFTPVIFSGEECWANPDDNALLNEILTSFDQNRDKVYSVGAPHEPDEVPNLYDVIEQLYKPNVQCPKFAVNLASNTAIRKPERFIHHKTDPNVTLTTTTNITPQYTRVELHAGMYTLGKFCVQQHGEALYIPPGYLHVTYTVEGGILPGTQYLTADCLLISSNLLEIDRLTCGLSEGDYQPLLEAVYL